MRRIGNIGRALRTRVVPAVLAITAVVTSSCGDTYEERTRDSDGPETTLFNTAHLDRLGEDVQHGDTTTRIIHIYSEAPDYGWVGDDDEGVACVDDAARAAVVYLRHYEVSRDKESLEKARSLIRFVMYMQQDNGLFYNFLWDNTLRINTVHQNSVADQFGWWAARAVWSLGTAARVLKEVDENLSRQSADRVRRVLPYLSRLLERHGETETSHGREYPLWLVYGYASDATSEMLMGLAALNAAYPSAEIREMIERFADGIARMQFGSMNDFPYGAHASYLNEWHGWGNSQTQALAEAGIPESAIREAEHFYPRLLIDGWMHSFRLDDPGSARRFSQIAYSVRGVAVGLVRLYEATGDIRYAKMAGLAASWFTGNNVAGAVMYDAKTGRGYDGINGPDDVNRNAGAESTVEALMTVLEVERIGVARRWMRARGGDPGRAEWNGESVLYRIFTTHESGGAKEGRLGLVAHLTSEKISILEGAELDEFLRNVST